MNSRILPICALIAAIGIFFWYVNPTWTVTIAATKGAIAADDSALVAAGEYTAQQSQLASERNAIDPTNLSRLSVLLPSSVDNIGLILNLNKLAADSGISLSNVNVVMSNENTSGATATGALPVSSAGPVGSADLSLSAIGTYSAFQTFLTGIEKSERLLDARDITVTGSDTGVYKYQMTLRLYWLH